MFNNPAKTKLIAIGSVIFSFCFIAFLFAQDPDTKSGSNLKVKVEKNLTELQKQARNYRNQGYAFHNAGDLDAALNLYQKAVEFDPLYALVYNDLGIIYEEKGFLARARESYLKAIQIDPNYLGAYANLALFYEGERDLEKAALYWQKRAELGSPDDPWTLKAKQRYQDIRLVLSDKPFEVAREQEVVSLLEDVTTDKSGERKSNKTLAKSAFDKAKTYYKRGDDVLALKTAVDASQLDPTNKEIQAFVDKVQKRILSK